MNEKTTIIGTSLIIFGLFLLTTIYIENLKESKIEIAENYSTSQLLKIIQEKYNFQGTWMDKTNNLTKTIPTFDNNEGICFLKIFEKITMDDLMDMYFNDKKSQTSFILEATILDTFSLSGKKLKLKEVFKESLIKGDEKNFNFNTNTINKQNDEKEMCDFQYGFFINDVKFKETKLLKDLEININFKSDDKKCLMNINANFKYSYERNISILKFSNMSIFLAFFELILILITIFKLNRIEYISKYQSIIFWIGMGMCNSLFFFINILVSFIQNGTTVYVFIGAFLNFVNLYLIILKVLHKIGLQNFLAMNDNNPQEARRFIASMHVKIYIIILLGMLFGMQNFPNLFLIYSIPFFYFAQIFYIFCRNDRLFPSILIHFSLTFCKIIFCYYSQKTVFYNQYDKSQNFNVIYFSTLLLFCGLILNQIQRKLGPRFIFKSFFNQNKHDYFVSYYEVEKELRDKDECPVCLVSLKEKIEFDDNVIPDLYEHLIYMGKLKENIIMKTPCTHYYHIGCLVSCMHYKQRCAVCREALPNWY